MNKFVSLAIGAGIGGALVYWWIKRTCPCQHAAGAHAVTAAAPVDHAIDVDADADSDGFDEPAAMAGGSTGTDGAVGSYGGASGASSSSCVSCGGAAVVAAPAPPAPTAPGSYGRSFTTLRNPDVYL